MRGKMKGKSSKIEFPKLMINENVVALFSDAENAIVVLEISDDAIEVGASLGKGTFEIERFDDYHGCIELSNR
jgi:hypothetical protein